MGTTEKEDGTALSAEFVGHPGAPADQMNHQTDKAVDLMYIAEDVQETDYVSPDSVSVRYLIF